MNTVTEILKSKPDHTIYTTSPSSSVFEAVTTMADKNVGALLVMNGDDLVGIITERHYARKIAILSRSSRETKVREIMTSEVLYVGPERTSGECMALMSKNRLRHLPVIDDGKLLGVVSIGDLVKDVISDQQFIIEQLEHYITGDIR